MVPGEIGGRGMLKIPKVMFDTIYIEDAVAQNPRAQAVLSRLAGREVVACRHYGELFNPKSQNFRLQKKRPALILAAKRGERVLPAPAGYGIGARRNYYFSHALNCVYDCRYCFLQGMYRSAHIVLFVNYEDFARDIAAVAAVRPRQATHFFSGYDGDSLALEPLSGFARYFIAAMREIPNAWLELRTKSTQVRGLLEMTPWPRCVVAFSFTPEPIAAATEHGVPPIAQRLAAMSKLQQHGWRIGLRLDPLIDCADFAARYAELLQQLFAVVDADKLHSVSFGPFRMPTGYFERVARLYPRERLFAGRLEKSAGMAGYGPQREAQMRERIAAMLLDYARPQLLFPCVSVAG